MKSHKTLVSHSSAAVVTGAGSGIGRSFALEIAKRGGSVICADIRVERAEETAEMIRRSGRMAHAVACDVGEAEHVRELSERAPELLERPVTLIVNNAGIGIGGPIGEVSLEDWKACLHVNLWGVIHGCHYFVPQIKALGYGGVINVASAAGFAAAPEMTTYNATKAGVLSLTETLYAELAGTGVSVTALCPTFVPTNIVRDGKMPENRKEFAGKAMTRFALTNSDTVAKKTLDALDKGRLYMLPQIDGRIAWLFKRATPSLYAKALGETYRLIAG